MPDCCRHAGSNFISQCSIGALGKADSLCKLGVQTGCAYENNLALVL